MRKVAYKEIRRFGYVKRKDQFYNPTGFISDDEEEEKNCKMQGEQKDYLIWLADFNTKMQKAAIKI